MAVSQKHNKPVLPRTSDGSDLGSNRASIYSGKGLNFDGVNDVVTIHEATDLWSGDFSVSWYGNLDVVGNNFAFSSGIYHGSVQAGINMWYGGASGLNFSVHFPESDGTGQQGYNLLLAESYLYWHRLDLVFVSSSRLLSLYQNGILVDTATVASNVDAAYMPNGWEFGRSYGGSYPLDGKLTNLKAFSTALTAAQVKELYDNPEQAVPTGVDATSLVLHLPMTEGAGSVVYNANAGAIGTELISNAGFDETCQKWGTTDDATVEIAGGKAIWTNAPLSGSFVEQPLDLEAGKFYRVSFDYTSTAFNLFVNLGDTQQAVPLGNGRFTYDMYYGTGNKSIKFQHGWTTSSSASVDNVSIKEVVPNYYNGTINGATWVSGLPEPLPQTALMDWNKGTNTITDSEDFLEWDTLLAGTGTVSVSQVYTENPNKESGAYRVQASAGSGYGLISRTAVSSTSGDYVASVYAKSNTGANQNVAIYGRNNSSNVVVVTPEWTRIVKPSSDNTNFINIGAISASDAEVDILVWGGQIEKDTTTVGAYIKTLGTAQTSPVLIKEGSTAGKDVFGNTITNPRASGAYNFDGNSWAEVQDNASLDVTDAVTLECWFEWDGSGNNGILGRWHSDSSNRNYLLYKLNATTLNFYINSSAAASYTSLNATKGWTHIVGTYNRTNAVLYIDGVQQAITAQTTAISTGTLPVEIGRNFTTSNQAINTQLSNPRIYNYALTAQQVADNFNEKASTFGGTKVASELDAYIERTASDGATVEAHSCLVNYLTELDKK